MLPSIWIVVVIFAGVFYVLTALVLRGTLRFSARCKPEKVPLEALPAGVSVLFQRRIPEITKLGFELIGCYDLGCLASETQSYVAYFRHYDANDFASISVLVSSVRIASYLEFSARFPNGFTLETNTNRILPLTPGNPEVKVFRFPRIRDAQALLRIHRQLKDRYAPGLWPQGEARGEEIQRLVRTIENYGPRHARLGYLRLAADGESYGLTWKGALVMTWRGLWPVPSVRRLLFRHAMNLELQSLETCGLTAMQKA